jgi:hypothetical protein
MDAKIEINFDEIIGYNDESSDSSDNEQPEQEIDSLINDEMYDYQSYLERRDKEIHGIDYEYLKISFMDGKGSIRFKLYLENKIEIKLTLMPWTFINLPAAIMNEHNEMLRLQEDLEYHKYENPNPIIDRRIIKNELFGLQDSNVFKYDPYLKIASITEEEANIIVDDLFGLIDRYECIDCKWILDIFDRKYRINMKSARA